MSAIHTRPLVCCDSVCALVNMCRVGGYQCTECGGWFCPDSDGGSFCDMRYTCRRCAEANEEEG